MRKGATYLSLQQSSSEWIQPGARNIARIAKAVDNVHGLKEAGNPENVAKVKAALGGADGYCFFSGRNLTFTDAFTTQGYNGITSIAGNVYPDQVKNIVDHLLKNETAQAKRIMENITPGIVLLEKAGMIQSIKYILRKKNVPVGYCPRPVLDVSAEIKQALDKIFFT
ncbi:unnamed protein product [Absidia cylindrospora]